MVLDQLLYMREDYLLHKSLILKHCIVVQVQYLVREVSFEVL